MATLRMSFKSWLDQEPEEPEDEEATEDYDAALREHAEMVSGNVSWMIFRILLLLVSNTNRRGSSSVLANTWRLGSP